MKNGVFKKMIADFEEAKKYRAGKKANLRISRVAFEPVELKPVEIRKVRTNLGLSQPEFAKVLCTSVAAVRSWEQGRRRPKSSARRLLAIAKERPAVLLERTA